MIELHNVTFQRKNSLPILDRISLKIGKGEYVSIMGPNGAGKTTLAYLLKGLLLPTTGRIVVDGIAVEGNADPSLKAVDKTRTHLIQSIGLVFQDPEAVFVSTTCEREIAFGLENMGIPPGEMEKRVTESLKRFNLLSFRHKNPLHLSGGEKQKLAIASVIAMQPRCLIMDEPTSLLDPQDRLMVTDLIDELSEKGETVIHISPFPKEAALADRLLILSGGKLLYDGSPELALDDRDFLVRCGIRRAHKIPDKIPRYSDSALVPVIRLMDVTATYRSGYPDAYQAIKGVSLDIIKGECTAVVGPAGSGKTTLLELAAGLMEPTDGLREVPGHSDGGNPVTAGTVIIGFAFQFPEAQIFAETVYDEVSFGPRNQRLSRDEVEHRVHEALRSVDFSDQAILSMNPHHLSEGEKRRVAIADVLSLEPDILVLDEPSSGLDGIGVSRLIELFRLFYDKRKTILFSSHDLDFVRETADRVIVLRDGLIESDGRTDKVFEGSEWLRNFR